METNHNLATRPVETKVDNQAMEVVGITDHHRCHLHLDLKLVDRHHKVCRHQDTNISTNRSTMLNLWTIVIWHLMWGIWIIRFEALTSTIFRTTVEHNTWKSKLRLKEVQHKDQMEVRSLRLKDTAERTLFKKLVARIMQMQTEIPLQKALQKTWTSNNYHNIYYNSNKIYNIWKMVEKAVQYLRWERLEQLKVAESHHQGIQRDEDKSHQAS